MAGQPTTSVPVKKLLSAITSTATAFSVSDILDWDGNALVTNRFGSTGYGVFRSPDGTQVEFFTFDGSTIANASITILTRGNDYNGGTTDNIKTKYAWPAGTLVELGSMAPAMLAQVTAATFNASSTVIGSSKLSLDPVSPTIPIAVGQNDPKVPPVNVSTMTAGQVAGLIATTTPGASNLFMTQKDVQRAQETYIASTGSANAYVVTYVPAVPALLEGQFFAFKANFSCTGAVTLAVNGLTAKAITKNGTTALVANDILSGQIILVRYDGTQFQMLNPGGSAPSTAPVYKVVSSSKNAADASAAQTIAHGLGVIPKYVRLTCLAAQGSGSATMLQSMAVYNGTTQVSQSIYMTGATSSIFDNSFTLNVSLTSGTTVGVVTFDATNITITWTKTGSPTGVYIITAEAFA